MIYKVVIIDDEETIVRGLSTVIPWADYRCEIVATASGVNSGIEAINRFSPDILFTDIRMPDGSGLNMLAGLKSEHPDMQVTVLTGFRDFNYAQQAISIGVTRFLLKPSKMHELVEAVEAMILNLDKLHGEPRTEPIPAPVPEDADIIPQSDESSSFIVRQAVAFIEEHCTEKIALTNVADSCYVSQWHLSKLLNKYTGQNFYDILNNARISKAKELMLDPALRIGDISEMVGYIDTPHFSRIFKKIEGISANEYRNQKLK